MKVGGVAETITVTGETPVVDVQSAKREVVMSTDVIEALPAARAAGRAAQCHARPVRRQQRPGAVADDDVLQRALERRQWTSMAGEGRMTVNGMTVAAAAAAAACRPTSTTRPTSQEVAITVGGGLGESDIGGPVMNLVPQVRRQHLHAATPSSTAPATGRAATT